MSAADNGYKTSLCIAEYPAAPQGEFDNLANALGQNDGSSKPLADVSV
jgi:hypothetical protein